jgi:hypothetical protein
MPASGSMSSGSAEASRFEQEPPAALARRHPPWWRQLWGMATAKPTPLRHE